MECILNVDLLLFFYIIEHWAEGATHFINNNYAHFIKRYDSRIKNFKNYLENENNFITFVLQFKNESNPNNDCKDLRDALAIRYPTLQYTIIII
jgi:phosphopantetheine adenylyltransferase